MRLPLSPGRLNVLDESNLSASFIQEANKLRNDVAAAELISALNDAGIESILLKGPSIARWLYDEGESRSYGDIDLLLPPHAFDEGGKIFECLGFRYVKHGDRLEDADRVKPWFRQQDLVVLEQHRGFAGIPATHQEFWDELKKDSEYLPLGVMNVTAQVPGKPARALLVGLHAAKEGAAGHRLEDLTRALRRLPSDVWVEAAALANRLGAEEAFAVGLSFVPEGKALVRELELKLGASTETLLRAANTPRGALSWEWFATAPGIRGKLRFAVEKLAPPPDFIRWTEPLGRRGGAWLALAYVVRPFRMARRAALSFRAWRDVRRRSAA